MTFLELKKNCKKPTAGMGEYKLAVVGDCATQHLAMALQGAAYERGIALTVFEAAYDQLRAELMDPASGVYEFAPNAILLYMSAERLYERFCRLPQAAHPSFAQTEMQKISDYWNYIQANSKAVILQYDFAELDDGVFGNFALKTPQSFLFQERELNCLLMKASTKNTRVYPISLNGIQSWQGRGKQYNPKYYYDAKIAISLETLPFVAFKTIDTIAALRGRVKKCIILDLDNTLWGGVIGDDGLGGIQIGELGIGQAFYAFQTWLKELQQRGILLAVCSKNNEDMAKAPFLEHPEMVLHLDDFAIFIANWEDKATNIRRIQQSLNLGMDSLVFIDDNPFERRLVHSLLPDICVPEMPEDPAFYITYLQGLNLFETVSCSDEDSKRTQQYQAEVRREELRENMETYDSYLESLSMVAEAKPFDPMHYARIAQLTQRSNQFNLRTVRYTEADIANIAQSPAYLTLYFTLQDRFGDQGLISVVILQKLEDRLFVDTWLMSCRVLKRGMEEFVVNKVVDYAKAFGYKTIEGEYLPTPKNAMVKDIYDKLGFKRIGDGKFSVRTDEFRPNKTWIREVKHDIRTSHGEAD